MPETFREALQRASAKLPTPVRLRAENAFSGFERAHALLSCDPHMASFRAITAEEEAATALFRSLQIRKYPGWKALNLRDHRQKAALWPLLNAIKMSMAGAGQLHITVTIDYRKKPSIQVQIPLSEIGVSFPGSEDLAITLVDPLGLRHSRGDELPRDVFDGPLHAIAAAANFDDIRKYIDYQKNIRNRLLYASDVGLPETGITAEGIEDRQRHADLALSLCVAVLQKNDHQTLAKQGLEVFLKMVSKLPSEGVTYDEMPPPDVIVKLNDENRGLTFVQPQSQ